MNAGHEEMWDSFRQARVCICDGWADVDGCDNGHGTYAEHVAAVEVDEDEPDEQRLSWRQW